VEKILEDANIKLSSIASDTFGASGKRIVEELMKGELKPGGAQQREAEKRVLFFRPSVITMCMPLLRNERSRILLASVSKLHSLISAETVREYGEENVKILGGLAAVRQVPSMYIGNTGVKGFHHVVCSYQPEVTAPAVRGADQEKPGNSEVKGLVETIMNDQIDEFLETNEDTAKILMLKTGFSGPPCFPWRRG
jgi:hypothetical protein